MRTLDQLSANPTKWSKVSSATAYELLVYLTILWGWRLKGYIQLELLPEVLTIAKLRHLMSRICTCAETEF